MKTVILSLFLTTLASFGAAGEFLFEYQSATSPYYRKQSLAPVSGQALVWTATGSSGRLANLDIVGTYVTLTGTQTVAGAKTFSSAIVASSGVSSTGGSFTTTNGNITATNGVVSGDTLRSSNMAVRSTGASFDVTLQSSEALSANRTLGINVGNANRTITFSGNPTLADWFDQSVKSGTAPTFTGTNFSGTASGLTAGSVTTIPTLSGDVTNSGNAVSIGSGKVTNAMLAGSIAYSKLSLTGAILNADLAGSIDLTSKVTGALPQANIAALTGDVTKPSGSGVTTLASIPAISGANLTGTAASLTAGNATFAAGLSATLAVTSGGTGQTTFTNGQLLIGNTTGNTLTKATLTGTANQVVVTNSTGSITLSTPQDIGTGSSPTFAGVTTASIKPASDSTTAIRVFKADGATAVGTWDTTNGYLGIGTTAPGVRVQVEGSSSSQSSIRIKNTSSSGYGQLLFSNDATADIWQYFVNGSAQSSNGGAGSFNIYGAGNNAFTLSTNSIERMRITGAGAASFTGTLAVTGASTLTGDVTTGGKIIAGAQVRLKGYTVATLPASPTQGDIVFVTDALAPSFLVTIVGGGSVVTQVLYNGTNWVAQ